MADESANPLVHAAAMPAAKDVPLRDDTRLLGRLLGDVHRLRAHRGGASARIPDLPAASATAFPTSTR